jgi:hypothetical protein
VWVQERSRRDVEGRGSRENDDDEARGERRKVIKWSTSRV